ncbi:long-chain-fatty-acid--CoA ligase [Nocardia sp. alder85J]|uniref:long-chain-fatty-acid--CoA ligase n=1 Tax=Nocardia sp. alder85J TaxID=2862949 RepID=UPI001CD1AF28|nr:long-chain fatty acid--CoA ligase [Nocardia sp. alder85J]MCX4098711.1 long-chain fatty acid--CoA ligase [Nocardia sp. alder85J]
MTATLSVASILAEPAWRVPDRLALVEGEQRITFAQMWRQVREQAAALIERGVRPGDRVALMCPNVADFPRAYYAILAAGGVVVPVHLLLSADEVEHVLRDSGAALLLAHPTVAPVGDAAAARAGIPSIDPKSLVAAEPIPTFVTRGPLDPAVIFYTSGTTGRPKGAELTHLNMVMCATVNTYDANQVSAGDIALGALPLFHVFGQTVSLNSQWRVGAALVLLPRFGAAAAVELMLAEGVNIFHGVPTMFVELIKAAQEAQRLPELRFCISGGASLPPSVLEEFQAAYGAPVLEGYGLSETSPTVTVNQPLLGIKPHTVGQPVWGVNVEIADPTVREEIVFLPQGEVGEVVVRGHNVFEKYIGNPEATATAVVDGWFRTGDLGVVDADGFLTIVDRIKEMIIRGGFNVYPTEVEAALLRHPRIAQVAVIGVPDEKYGEEVVAVVVPDGEVAAAEIIDFAKEHVARYKYPRRVEFLDELPLGPTHKVLKRELKERFL